MIGTGKMGRCLAQLLKCNSEVTICSRSEGKARAAARRMGIGWGGIDAIARSDITIATAPTEAVPALADQAAKLMPHGALFVDVSSVKMGLIEKVAGRIPHDSGYISIHPLFTSPRVKARNIVAVRVKDSDLSLRFCELLCKSGARIIEATAEEHDRAMAVTQVLHHFALMALERALDKKASGIDLDRFCTHSLSKTMAVLRLIRKNYETVKMIQRENVFGKEIREEFLREACKLDEELSGPPLPNN